MIHFVMSPNDKMTWIWRDPSMSLCATTKWLRNGIKLGHQGSDEMNGMYPPPSGRSHDRTQTPHLRSPLSLQQTNGRAKRGPIE